MPRTQNPLKTKRAAAALVSFSLLLSACGGDSVDHEALVSALTSQDQMTQDEATCVADAIFAEGKFDEDAMKQAAADITAVDGFSEAVNQAFDSCLTP